MNLLGTYKNGNYHVQIFDDGTKIRETIGDSFIPSFSENCDIKISNYCDIGCPMCHENSTINGKHGDILNKEFIDSLHPYTELAIGGGNALAHPDLIEFLQILKEKKVIANITVNQIHFEKFQNFISQLIYSNLVKGIGVSLMKPTKEFIELIKKFPNAVVHVINGVISQTEVEILANNNIKMLILGYKQFRRGNDYYIAKEDSIKKRQAWLYQNIENIIPKFEVLSFDNLAIEQLNLKRIMSDKDWEEFYMGDDGTVTFYIDMVERKFAKSSTSEIRYDLLNNIDDMFNVIVKAGDEK